MISYVFDDEVEVKIIHSQPKTAEKYQSLSLTEQEFKAGNKIGIYHTTYPITGYKKIKCSYIEESWKGEIKKYVPAIAELKIPENSTIVRAREYDEFFDIYSDANEEVRTDRAIVTNITPYEDIKYDKCYSLYDNSFTYKINKIIKPKNYFNIDENTQQGAGIHFFINKNKADSYDEPCYRQTFKDQLLPSKYEEIVY